MTESSNMFGITLEDYSAPRYKGETTLYCGTREEVSQFLGTLSQKEWTKIRYAQMIQAYSDSAKKSYPLFDKEYPTNHRMQLLYTQEDFVNEHFWEYKTSDGSIYHLYAKRLIISRLLAKDSENIYRFIRVRIFGLEVNVQGCGWIKLRDQIQGFPGVYSHEKDQHIMNLYICVQTYDMRGEYLAFRHVQEFDSENELPFITRDLLGEGLI